MEQRSLLFVVGQAQRRPEADLALFRVMEACPSAASSPKTEASASVQGQLPLAVP